MRGLNRIHFVLAAAGLLLLAPACSTDSPTAPQQNPPPPGGGVTQTSWRITVTADPDQLFKFEPDNINAEQCGGDPADIKIVVEAISDGRAPVNGTTIVVRTDLGSFVGAITPLQETVAEIIGGVARVQLFPCQTPGLAQVRAQLGTSTGQVRINIDADPFDARFTWSNPDSSRSVQFTETASGPFNSLEWKFGDGSTSTEPNPFHVYSATGIYTVRLTIRRGGNTDTCTVTLSTADTEGRCPAGQDPPAPPIDPPPGG